MVFYNHNIGYRIPSTELMSIEIWLSITNMLYESRRPASRPRPLRVFGRGARATGLRAWTAAWCTRDSSAGMASRTGLRQTECFDGLRPPGAASRAVCTGSPASARLASVCLRCRAQPSLLRHPCACTSSVMRAPSCVTFARRPHAPPLPKAGYGLLRAGVVCEPDLADADGGECCACQRLAGAISALPRRNRPASAWGPSWLFVARVEDVEPPFSEDSPAARWLARLLRVSAAEPPDGPSLRAQPSVTHGPAARKTASLGCLRTSGCGPCRGS